MDTGSLRAIIQEEIRNSDVQIKVRQLQGSARVDAGTSSVTWDGVSNLSSLTVNHSLGVAPEYANVVSTGVHYLSVLVVSKDESQVVFQVSNVAGAPPASTEGVSWVAVS